jgi:FixJ family two-component response regulator
MRNPDLTVFVVDDDASFLASVERLLRANGFPVKTFSSGTDFLAQRPPDAPGCVVTDLQMAGMTGEQLQDVLSRSENPLPIVFLTGHGDIRAGVNAMRHGAEDFLTKRAPSEDLIAAVRRAVDRDARERESRARHRELTARFETLTWREREVLAHVLRGRLNKQTAAALGIDERSVKRHRTNLMSKLQVESVAELVHLAMSRGSLASSIVGRPDRGWIAMP